MSKGHKDLPAGSQPWASEVDKAMAKVTALETIVRRLTENAGIDMSNPKRGINTGSTPNAGSPVSQKVSSLADVDTYNVLDGQVLSWSGKGQKWLPVTLASAGGAIDIPMAYSAGDAPLTGYGQLNEAGGVWAYTGTNPLGDAEMWATRTMYFGSGNYDTGPVSLIQLSHDGFGRPYVQLDAQDFADGTQAYLVVSSYSVRLGGYPSPTFEVSKVSTANRPTILPNTREGAMVYDSTLGIPIWWNGTAWTNALGTVV